MLCFLLKTVYFNDVFLSSLFHFLTVVIVKKSNQASPHYVITVIIWKACIMGKNTK